MELRHFRVFAILAEELHFGRTAHRLNTVQPAVSKTLKDIEAEVGVTLIDRSARKVELTNAGRAFLVAAEQALQAAELAVRAARSSVIAGVDRLTLGLTIGAAQPVVGELVAQFRRDNPVAEISIVELNEASLGRAVSDDEVDAAIAWDRSVPAGLKSLHFCEVPMSVLVPVEHPLASQNQVSMADLDKELIIVPARSAQPVLFETYRTYCEDHSVAPMHAIHVATTADMLALIAGGAGIGHAPIPEGLSYPGIKVLRQEPPFFLSFALVWSRDGRATKALLKAHEALVLREPPL